MKLTKEIRENIIAAVVAKAGLRDELKNALDAIKAEAVAEWERSYPAALTQFSDWLSFSRYAYFIDEAGHSVSTSVELQDLNLIEKKGATPRIRYTPMIRVLMGDAEEIEDKITRVIELAHAVVYSCTTRKQLVETAPELEEFLPEEQKSGALVDLATVDRLRALLGGKP